MDDMKDVRAVTYQTIEDADSNGKLLVGVVTQNDLASAFGWFAESKNGLETPEEDLIQALKVSDEDLYFLIFGGTWCEDTEDILPKFFKVQELAGFPEERITVFMLDRFKKLAYTLPEAFNITHTPTFLIMKAGKEAGRLVEYGKTGNWQKELAEMIKR